MADLKLKSIHIRNWMKFRKVQLNFPEKGLVVVIGHNLASGGALQSVGSGKTGLGEAISHALLGVSSHFDHVGDYSCDNNGDTYVCLEADFLGKPLKVEMGYKCKELKSTGEALQYSYDGKTPISLGRLEQTRASLTKLLGVPQLLARWSVFVDGDNLKFNKLSQADSVELVMSALRQPPWSEYHEQSKKVLGKFKQALTKDQTRHEEALRRVKESEQDVEDAQETVSTEEQNYNSRKARNDKVIQEQQARINTANEKSIKVQERRAAIAVLVEKSVAAKAERYHKLEIEANAINERIQSLQVKTRPMIRERDLLLSNYANADTAAKNYEKSGKSKDCPTCRRPMAGVTLDPEHVLHLQKAANIAQVTLDKKEAEYTTLGEEIKSQQVLLETNRQKTAELGADEVAQLSGEDEQLENALTELQNGIHQMELALNIARTAVSDADLKAAQTTLKERQRMLNQSKQDVVDASAELASSGALLGTLEYWNLAFSPYGIPNMVLRDAIAPLNKEAKRISSLMTGGTLNVAYSTRRELASGMDKAQLVVEIDNKLGSQDLRGNSKGEAGLTNFIIAETLSEVGQVSRRIGFRWYDEVLPNQDPTICKSIYQYLRQISNRLGIVIFLVTHDPNAANYADHVLVVEKKGTPPNVIGNAKFTGSAELA